VLIGVQVVAAARPAPGQERLRAGMKDLGIAGGYSISHRTHAGGDDVDGWHVLPHLGFVLTDEQGPGWWRGNFELLAEPMLVHFRSDRDSGTAGGLAALGRWVFATPGVVRPYLEAGVGLLGGQLNFRQTNCDVNYLFEVGPGALWFVSDTTAVTLGYRFQHVSNGDACDKNLGLNSSVFILGISHFFP
jgi:opacity protein-like surface antigen